MMKKNIDVTDVIEESTCDLRGSISMLSYISENSSGTSMADCLDTIITIIGKAADRLDEVAEHFMKESD